MKPMRRLYLVSASRGEYSDRTEWEVCAFENEAEGQAFAVRCEQALRDGAERYSNADPDGNMSHEENRALVAKLDAKLPDPFPSVADYGARDASYYCGVLYVGRPPTRKEWEAELAKLAAQRAVHT